MSSYCEEPVHLISNVAQMLDIHPQTLRQYEREGLIIPSRTNGKIRLYSQIDIDEIKYILQLTRVLGINIAGVKMILEQNQIISSMQDKINVYEKKQEDITRYGNGGTKNALVVQKTSFDIVVFKE
ncbi:MAG: MerR family transcriptional regulator [Campylobacteraceae bacterium]|jgi:MerR family transcriptional regulator/heat shock protein HspR|nr:MerR family transcriptional regulator [Campylobacteraceae bacterium]MBT3882093.1 MerR family transcriptional regulator [Campylobacteraceae bacterium]MBT4030126.1 MerR family transcriptional regulator [Campylobacteraceae bacterium]MBT4178800.1 MerR family transcriptional regulator [Campylobacteraceae bacterium]MBT4572029.1 MerR family transcriptional regulator [Campylobacteraceae bacterium]